MKSLDGAIGTLHLLDDLAAEDTPLTRLAPLAKTGALFLYLAAFASLGPNHLAGACLLLLPLPVLYRVGQIPWKPALRQCLPVLLLLAGVGAVNLFFAQGTAVTLGTFRLSAGAAAFLLLLLKGLGCVLSGWLLLATTSLERLACALQKLPLPQVLIISTLLTWRYLVLLLQEGRRMQQAYALRAPRTGGIPWRISGSLLGLLFLRSLDRARTVYESMELRGFQGRFPETGAESSICASLLLVILTLVWCLVCWNLG